jgi:hypothetical protein
LSASAVTFTTNIPSEASAFLTLNDQTGVVTFLPGYGYNGGNLTINASYEDPATNQLYNDYISIYVQPCFGQLTYGVTALTFANKTAAPTFKIGSTQPAVASVA